MWQRFMKKALKNTSLIERFTEHDLRAKVASDTGTQHTQKLLGHASAEIIEKKHTEEKSRE